MTEINVETFQASMNPGSSSRPTTWGDWWWESTGREHFVPGLGIVKKLEEDEETDSYGDAAERSMVFELVDCGPPRWFRVVVDGSSYGSMNDDPISVAEVRPEPVQRQIWRAV